MALPLKPPVLPQLARSAKDLPAAGRWSYEPKWDGFRCIAFVDGADVELQSRNGRSLTRYFPELAFPEGRYVLDGEIVVLGPGREPDFDLLGQRIHPATSRVRTLDAVVRGWRPGKAEGTLGALILGLYGDDGRLREIGHSSGFTAREKRELPAKLAPYETGERGSGEPSRWTQGRDLEWIALRPELVVEIAFDHVSDGRIRHGSKVQRWRDDKAPEACTVDQLEQ